MSATLYPYPTLFGSISLDVTRIRLDGRPVNASLLSASQRAVALHEIGHGDWSEGSLEVRVFAPDRELAGGPWKDVTCVAVLTEAATDARIVRRLTWDQGSQCWQGTVPVLRTLHHERAILRAHLVATVDKVAGRVIGQSDNFWVIDLTSREPVRQREIEIVPVDFRDGPEEWLRPFKDSPWLVTATGEPPTVYLNESFEGIAAILRDSGSETERAAARLVSAQIAQETWTAMFHAAVTDLDTDEDGTPQIPGGWRESLLRAMLPDVMPGLPATDALFEVHRRRQDAAGWAELQSRIHYAAGRRAQLPKSLTMTIRALARTQAEEDSR
ncbi:hypothetical protein [Streptomyces sp. NPDC057072]|uniref:hypothetical protein n=1 Tax=Streptomyces sp. NPDC057072 TaxID=3346014 RepID=UPI00362D6AD0